LPLLRYGSQFTCFAGTKVQLTQKLEEQVQLVFELARLEAAVALSAVTRRFPDARQDGEPAYKPNVTLRGMSTLDVAV
jgi:hypothetical protein